MGRAVTAELDALPKAEAISFATRARMIVLLAAVEIPVLAALFNPLSINHEDPVWLGARAVLRAGVRAAPCFLAALAVMLWPRRTALMAR
ncbi:MAG TPA: hypothetical protein VNH64_06850, partial [Parvularculaceae bacterium]|nr:hypothetical protein [Parvularculaceae bacterium]